MKGTDTLIVVLASSVAAILTALVIQLYIALSSLYKVSE